MPSLSPTDPLTRYRIAADTEPIGTIGIPVRDHLNAATVTSLIMSVLSSGVPGPVDFNIVQGSLLPTQRNELIGRMRGDWLLFIDDDMVWQPSQIADLVRTRDEHDLDMLGGLCFRRSAPHDPTLYMRESPTAGSYNSLETWDSDLVEVDATGMAFIVIAKRVFEGLVRSHEDPTFTFPPYAERVTSPPPRYFRQEGRYGEDLRFCQDAKQAGYRIWVDTRIEIGHMAEVEIRHRSFLREMADRPAAAEAAKTLANTRMGLPTLTRAQARAALDE